MLAEELPPERPFGPDPPAWAAGFERLTLFGFAVLALVLLHPALVDGTEGFVPLDGDEVFWIRCATAAAALAVFLLLAAAALKGKSWFGGAMARVVACALIFFPYAGYWLMVYFNARLDPGRPMAHKALVLSKSESHSRNSITYRVVLPSWRPGHQEESLRVSWRAFQQVRPQQTVATVLTKPGRWGHEWILGYRFDTRDVRPLR